MVKLYNDGKRITAALSGDIDHHAAREMRRELDEVIERSQPELLIIDMENVGFMDSSLSSTTSAFSINAFKRVISASFFA